MSQNPNYTVDTVLEAVPLDPPVCVPAAATLREVAGEMVDEDVSCVLVGMGSYRVASDHDLARALAAGLPADTPISEVTTRPLVWATPATTVLEAAVIMVNHRIRHLIVVESDGRPRGILALTAATAMLIDIDVPLGPWSWQ